MKQLLLVLLLALPFASPAQATYPRHRLTHRPATAPRSAATTAPKVYVCGGGSAYAYHNSGGCAGLNRCSHGVSAVTVAEAEVMGRRPCKKCY
jgi:hypothetical protein